MDSKFGPPREDFVPENWIPFICATGMCDPLKDTSSTVSFHMANSSQTFLLEVRDVFMCLFISLTPSQGLSESRCPFFYVFHVPWCCERRFSDPSLF